MTEIQRVKLLTGHVSEETAYHVDDYPYGFHLRCQIRYWVETAVKGAKKGQQRFMSQTTNPKRGDIWNKPKAGQYYGMVFMYLNDDDHVKSTVISAYDGPIGFTRMRFRGIPDQLIESDRKLFDAFEKMSQRVSPSTWTTWTDTVGKIAAHIRDTGGVPEIENRVWDTGNGRHIVDPADVYFAAARELLGTIV